jgi:nucleoside-diphosphate-sugar epimerase
LDTRIIRIFNCYGPRLRFNDGRVVSNFIAQALTNKPLTIYGEGQQTRSFQYVSDLVEGIVRLMKVDYHKPVNLGNPQERTVAELAKLIKEMTGSKSEIVKCELPIDDPKRRLPDITLAKSLLDWTPKKDITEGLRATIDWYKENVPQLMAAQK